MSATSLCSSFFSLCLLHSFFLRPPSSGGEARSEHKEGFDPLNAHSVKTTDSLGLEAARRFRTVDLGAKVALSF